MREPISSPAAFTNKITSSSATSINNLKRINLGAKILKVAAIIPITKIGVFALALFKTIVAAIRNVAAISLDGMRPKVIGKLSMPLALSSLKSFKTFAKWADRPSSPPAQRIQSGGVRSVEMTIAAGRSAKASAYGIGENAVGFK